MSEYAIGATSPPVCRGRPWVAALLGASLGPVGTFLYFRAPRAAWMTCGVYLVLCLSWRGGPGLALGLAFCSIYGTLRVMIDNARQDAAERAEARRAAEAMCRPPVALLEASCPTAPVEPEPLAVMEVVEVAAPAAPVAPAEPVMASEPEAPMEPPSSAPVKVPAKRGRPKGSRKAAA